MNAIDEFIERTMSHPDEFKRDEFIWWHRETGRDYHGVWIANGFWHIQIEGWAATLWEKIKLRLAFSLWKSAMRKLERQTRRPPKSYPFLGGSADDLN